MTISIEKIAIRILSASGMITNTGIVIKTHPAQKHESCNSVGETSTH